MQSTCEVPGCDRQHRAKGYCLMHYKRVKNHGDPNCRRPKTPAPARFWAKVDQQGGASACWPWTGGRISTGYGGFHPTKHETVLAHRYAYEQANGPIPDGKHIDHLCRNRQCCNPAHLEAVDPLVNNQRGLGWRLLNGMDSKCINGHEYTPENMYVTPDRTSVKCRQCARDKRGYLTAGKITIRERINKLEVA